MSQPKALSKKKQVVSFECYRLKKMLYLYEHEQWWLAVLPVVWFLVLLLPIGAIIHQLGLSRLGTPVKFSMRVAFVGALAAQVAVMMVTTSLSCGGGAAEDNSAFFKTLSAGKRISWKKYVIGFMLIELFCILHVFYDGF